MTGHMVSEAETTVIIEGTLNTVFSQQRRFNLESQIATLYEILCSYLSSCHNHLMMREGLKYSTAEGAALKCQAGKESSPALASSGGDSLRR